ncbi:hypothetical protein BDW22DRAFT_1423195 [Trametopsis cervina]|nr:hypothetical protein BDW22DRAFT_1423195 [Trametopsis cervina]
MPTIRTKAPKKLRFPAEADSPALTFGHIPNVPVGSRWGSRKECSAACVHPPLIAGIYGRKDDGARSVVLSGKSEFADEDHGETFTYIGSGGREPGVRFGPQTIDQSFDNNLNFALRRSALLNRPVRVIRGAGKSKYSPYHGYRYDGLYSVSNPRLVPGPEGLLVCQFDFSRLPNQDPLPTEQGVPKGQGDIAERRRQYRATGSTQQRASGSRESSSHNEEEEEEDLEALFTSSEEVEEELLPVLSQLAEFSRDGGSSAQKKARRELILIIGRRIKAVLQRKAEQGHDVAWWRNELWGFVAKAAPSKRRYGVDDFERIYEKFERVRAERENPQAVKAEAEVKMEDVEEGGTVQMNYE